MLKPGPIFTPIWEFKVSVVRKLAFFSMPVSIPGVTDTTFNDRKVAIATLTALGYVVWNEEIFEPTITQVGESYLAENFRVKGHPFWRGTIVGTIVGVGP